MTINQDELDKEIADDIYCVDCGSCGEYGCCSPLSCKNLDKTRHCNTANQSWEEINDELNDYFLKEQAFIEICNRFSDTLKALADNIKLVDESK